MKDEKIPTPKELEELQSYQQIIGEDGKVYQIPDGIK